MRIKDGANLRRARERKGLSQGTLAQMARCSQTTIWKLEKDKLFTISENLGAIIAHFLDRDVEELFEIETSTSNPSVTSAPMGDLQKRSRRSRKPVTRRRPPATELKAS